MQIIKHKAVVLGIVVGVVTLGSATAFALSGVTASPIKVSGRIAGCYNKTTGVLRVRLTKTCPAGTAYISWLGELAQATVNANGTSGNSWGIKSVQHTKTGIYLITLDGSSANCVQTATLAFTSGQISVEGNANFVPDEVQVQTYDSSGAPADRTFQFHQSCA